MYPCKAELPGVVLCRNHRVMEPALHSSLIALLVLLTSVRLSSTKPAILGRMKSTEVTVSKEPHHRRHHGGTDSTELERLNHELHRVTRELAHTKEALEGLKTQMEQRLNNFSTSSSPANLEMSCRTTFTVWHETVGKSLEYLDNFDVHCYHGEFLRQWRMTWGERGKKKAIKFVCCKFVSPGAGSEGRLWK